jgi:RNA polymerase sigma factor (sigma-70 family)
MAFTTDVQSRDAELIRACRQGILGGWERLLAQYERLVFSVPLHHGLSNEDAADIAQLTFTILLQSLDTLRDDSNLAAWLCTIARRHTWRVLKRGQHQALDELDAEFLRRGAALMDKPDHTEIEYWELASWLQQGLGELNARCQELLRTLYFDDKQPSYADVAVQLGLPVGSIGPTRARCLAQLKQLLEQT